MLSRITIKNFGLIDTLSTEFEKGLNILTGATGAGKSILIDALNYSLGKRMNSSQVRDPQSPCIVETVFEISDEHIKDYPEFSEYIEEDEDLLIINRTYSPDGKNKNKINGFTVTTSQLKELGNHLIDIHGPHDHQMLLSEDSHMKILDRLSDIEDIKKDYSAQYNEYCSLQKKLNELMDMFTTREREQETLLHQIKELEQVSLENDKYEALLQGRTRINNAENLYECVQNMINLLENEQSGISSSISKAFGPLRTLCEIDESAVNCEQILYRIQEDSSELSSILNNYLDDLSFEPGEAEEINRKYDIYYEITRKYGPTLDDAKQFYETSVEKHKLLTDLEHNDTELRSKIDSGLKDISVLAGKLTDRRKKTAAKLKKTIEQELKELGIPNIRFECRIEKTELNRSGQDRIVFYISPNAGEDLKPLAEIVSSGEAARVMLALKKALTKADPIPVLIFDEIDAQIGGRLGTITGKKLKELSSDRQVILITHLPQIAAFAVRHFKVYKTVENGHTMTNVELLDNKARLEELAQMMSGEEESQIALKHAKDMLNQAK